MIYLKLFKNIDEAENTYGTAPFVGAVEKNKRVLFGWKKRLGKPNKIEKNSDATFIKWDDSYVVRYFSDGTSAITWYEDNILPKQPENLIGLNLGEEISSIEECVFKDCKDLSAITVNEYNQVYDSRDNCNAIVKTANNSLMCGCKNAQISTTIESIGNYAFSECNGLKEITIPVTVNSIGKYAFYNCKNLEKISLGPQYVADYILEGCTNLKELEYNGSPHAFLSLGTYALPSKFHTSELPIESIVYGNNNSLTNELIGLAFSKLKNLKKLEIGYYVREISTLALSGCTELEEFIFNASNLISSVVSPLKNSLKILRFGTCNQLQTAVVLNNANIFAGFTKLEQVEIGDKIVAFSYTNSVGNGQFQGCTSLSAVTVGAKVTTIPAYTFNRCFKLAIINFGNTRTTVPTLSNINAFAYTPTNKYIIVPDSLYTKWIASTNWSSTSYNIKDSIIKYSDYLKL